MVAYIDEIAAIAAMKHSKTAVVTASIDWSTFYRQRTPAMYWNWRQSSFDWAYVDGSVRDCPFDEFISR